MKQKTAWAVFAVVVASTFLGIFPLGAGWTTLNQSTVDTKPRTLSVPTAKADGMFNFTNDTKVVTYSLKVDVEAGKQGKQINITFHNWNGTQFNYAITKVNTKACGCDEWTECRSVASGSVGSGGGTTAYAVTNMSVILTFVCSDAVCISITFNNKRDAGEAPGNPEYWINDTANCGGYVEVKETGAYLDPLMTTTNRTFNQVNMTNWNTVLFGEYAVEFQVNKTGYMRFVMNVTNATVGGGAPNFQCQVLLKCSGAGQETRILGKHFKVGNSETTDNGYGSKFYNIDFYAYLETGKTYVLVMMGTGYVKEAFYTDLPTTAFAINNTGGAVAMPAAPNALAAGKNYWAVYLSLPALKYGTLYDVTVDAPAYPWELGVSEVVGEGADYLVTGAKMIGITTQVLFVEDKTPACTLNGEAITNTVTILRKTMVANTNGNESLEVQIDKKSISKTLFAHPLLAVFLYNNTVMPNAIASLNVKVAENAAGVPELPGTAVSGEDGYFSTTLAFQNDGAADNQSIYKISNKKGKELQMQVTAISGIDSEPNTATTYKFTLTSGLVFGGLDAGLWTPGAGTSFQTSNTTYRHANGDSARIYEVAIFGDLVYVMFNTVNSYVLHAETRNSNTSSISLKYTWEAFKKSGDSFVVSRDNKIQVFEVDIPVCGRAKLEYVYGGCCATSGTAYAISSPVSGCLRGAAYTSLSVSQNGANFGLCAAFHAFVVLDEVSINSIKADQAGSVLKFTITSCVTTDWLAWGIAIVAIVALIVVAACLSRKKA